MHSYKVFEVDAKESVFKVYTGRLSFNGVDVVDMALKASRLGAGRTAQLAAVCSNPVMLADMDDEAGAFHALIDAVVHTALEQILVAVAREDLFVGVRRQRAKATVDIRREFLFTGRRGFTGLLPYASL